MSRCATLLWGEWSNNSGTRRASARPSSVLADGSPAWGWRLSGLIQNICYKAAPLLPSNAKRQSRGPLPCRLLLLPCLPLHRHHRLPGPHLGLRAWPARSNPSAAGYVSGQAQAMANNRFGRAEGVNKRAWLSQGCWADATESLENWKVLYHLLIGIYVTLPTRVCVSLMTEVLTSANEAERRGKNGPVGRGLAGEPGDVSSAPGSAVASDDDLQRAAEPRPVPRVPRWRCSAFTCGSRAGNDAVINEGERLLGICP